MSSPEKHALLSASSASRWLKCTAAPRFEEQFPEKTSEYAEEGRLAHSVCELKVLKKFTTSLTPKTYTTRLNKLKKDPLYADEMDKTSEKYIDFLSEKAMSYNSTPFVTAEVQVDLTEFIPEGFGTCDCVMIGGDTLNIVDYKHGKGVAVSAENNAQMRLYALGALRRYYPLYGDLIQNVCMSIVQPRIKDVVESETISVSDLREWGESIKPIAEIAFSGKGEFNPGEHCRFCRGKAQCKARNDKYSAFEEFKNCIPNAKNKNPNVLTDDEIGVILEKAKGLVKWYKDLEEYALNATLQGKNIYGWKAVAGKSNRAFSDSDKAIETLLKAGYERAVLYEQKPKTLSELEKFLGAEEFNKLVGNLVVKPKGKPTLVPVSDKREPYNSAVSDFSEIAKQ